MDENCVFLYGDYFSIVKALRDRETWQQIGFPIAMVVFGESEVGRGERVKMGHRIGPDAPVP